MMKGQAEERTVVTPRSRSSAAPVEAMSQERYDACVQAMIACSWFEERCDRETVACMAYVDRYRAYQRGVEAGRQDRQEQGEEGGESERQRRANEGRSKKQRG